MTDLIEDQPSPDLPAERTCSNCGCAARMTRKGELFAVASSEPGSFVVCRRNMPQASEVRGRQPRVDPATGQPMRNAQNQQLFEEVTAIQIGYAATLPEAVCFDGWRPAGTLPGVRWEAQRMVEGFRPFLEKALIQSGISRKAAEEMGHAMLTGMLPPRP